MKRTSQRNYFVVIISYGLFAVFSMETSRFYVIFIFQMIDGYSEEPSKSMHPNTNGSHYFKMCLLVVEDNFFQALHKGNRL